ncbi:hypothetical protein OGAPHI_006572 [Ogataea philodendri]|uniref:AAA+ ATPase domain-containing protein n=1 Tax=Ogataea philodendri TaxID=1378263 RepID=A0A9P8NX84_9ASCO|nr:uncharacterized protein OGAPHI_006572 [Ogataea philodendri]KAH3661165.1 hypothetical protein OGAPHI_006572 [Ogataea philodendri]
MNVLDSWLVPDSRSSKKMNTPAEIFKFFREKDSKTAQLSDISSDQSETPEIISETVVEPPSSGVSIASVLMPQKTQQVKQPETKPLHDPHHVVLKYKTKQPKSSQDSLLKNGRFPIQSARLRPDSLVVKLKISPAKLKSLDKPEPTQIIDLEAEPVPEPVKRPKPMNSFFQSVADRARKAEIAETSKKQRVQSMELPVLKKDDFMVYDNTIDTTDTISISAASFLHKTSIPQDIDEMTFTDQEHSQFVNHYNTTKPKPLNSSYIYSQSADTMDQVVAERYGRLTDPAFERFFNTSFDGPTTQWCDLFKPAGYRDILQPESLRTDVYLWIRNMFAKLTRVDITKRTSLLRKKRISYEMDDFLVNDFDSGEETEDEVFLPSLIIEGPTGCGKTAAVYSIVKEQLKGYVYELNSGQNRARRNISFHLKQIGTTKDVKHSQDHGLILFDDVDLIDPEDDKEFWTAAMELLTYSYRPVIFTTNDIAKVPANIVRQSTVYCFQNVDNQLKTTYLDLVALKMRLKLDPLILQDLAALDLRHALMELQLWGDRCAIPENGLAEVQKRAHTEPQQSKSLRSLDLEHDLEYCRSFAEPEPENFENVLNRHTLDFYSSKMLIKGSRMRAARYVDGDDYLQQHPGCSLNRLSSGRFAADVTPFIKEMARGEMVRVQLNQPRVFGLDPMEYFDKLF